MTTAPPIPASRGPAAKLSASHGRTSSSSSTDPSSPATSKASGSDGGPITSFLTILQGVITAIGITTKTAPSLDEEPSPSGNSTGSDGEGSTTSDEGDAANVSETSLIPAEISLSVVATLPTASDLQAGEALANQTQSGKIRGVGAVTVGSLSTGAANGSAIPLVEAGSPNQGLAGPVAALVGESSIAANPRDPSQTTVSEEAAGPERTPGSMPGPNIGEATTGRGDSFGRRGSADGSFPPGEAQATVGMIEANFTSATTLHSPTAFGPNGSVLEQGAGSRPTELTTVDATAPGNTEMTGVAPSSPAWTGVTGAPAALLLADLPTGHVGAPPEVARAVPSQILPLLDRLPHNGAALVLRLDPPSLGTVILRVVAGEGRRVRLHFQVEDPAVGTALEDGWGQLETALRAQGLLPEGFTVDLNSAHHPNGRSGQGASTPGHDASPSGHRDAAVPTRDQPAASTEIVDLGGSGRYIDYRL